MTILLVDRVFVVFPKIFFTRAGYMAAAGTVAPARAKDRLIRH
jgi:hypothetical protein